ncbi:lipoyl(octanoyl) transferase LipB [Candidatus Tokpelaia sp.]|nr:lipoyl(octanoyl) transferase LipB [Candidatus Tokpelaia sp.]
MAPVDKTSHTDLAAAKRAGTGVAVPAVEPICRFMPQDSASPAVEWRVEQGLTPYPETLAFMEERVEHIAAGTADELIWLVEHPALYTAGTSAQAGDLLTPGRFPVYTTGRGGRFTYHGPGQRVIYIMLDLKRRKQDIRALVTAIEKWGINSLAEFGIKAMRRQNRVGLWVDSQSTAALPPHSEAKIAAIGLRLRKWVSFHGMAVNIAPDLEHYSGIVPCGLAEYGVTSMAQLGKIISFAEWDKVLQDNFRKIFGKVANNRK